MTVTIALNDEIKKLNKRSMYEARTPGSDGFSAGAMLAVFTGLACAMALSSEKFEQYSQSLILPACFGVFFITWLAVGFYSHHRSLKRFSSEIIDGESATQILRNILASQGLTRVEVCGETYFREGEGSWMKIKGYNVTNSELVVDFDRVDKDIRIYK